MKNELLRWNSWLSILAASVILLSLFVIYSIPSQQEEIRNAEQDIVPIISKEQDSVFSLMSEGETLFKENCRTCHSIQSVEVGPALYGVTTRRNKKWLYQFVRNPYILLKRKDTAAIHIFQKFNYAPHTRFETFTDKELSKLFEYISDEPETLPTVYQEAID